MAPEDIQPGIEIIVPGHSDGAHTYRPYRLRIDKVLMRSRATGNIEVGGTVLRLSGAPTQKKRSYRTAVLNPANVELAPLNPGDPIPPAQNGGMEGFVVGECGHRIAASEWRAGYRNCERDGG